MGYVIPSHTFPTKETAPAPEALVNLLAAFPIIETMMDKDQDLEALLKDYPKTKAIVLGYGEEREF